MGCARACDISCAMNRAVLVSLLGRRAAVHPCLALGSPAIDPAASATERTSHLECSSPELDEPRRPEGHGGLGSA